MAKSHKKYRRYIEPEHTIATYICYAVLIIAWNRFNCTNLVGVVSLESDSVSDSDALPAPVPLDPWDINENQQDIFSNSGTMTEDTSSSTDFAASATADTQPIQGWQYYCWNSTVGYEVYKGIEQKLTKHTQTIQTCFRIIEIDNVDIIEITHWDFSRPKQNKYRESLSREREREKEKKPFDIGNKWVLFASKRYAQSVHTHTHSFSFRLKLSTKQEYFIDYLSGCICSMLQAYNFELCASKRDKAREVLRKFNFIEFE